MEGSEVTCSLMPYHLAVLCTVWETRASYVLPSVYTVPVDALLRTSVLGYALQRYYGMYYHSRLTSKWWYVVTYCRWSEDR